MPKGLLIGLFTVALLSSTVAGVTLCIQNIQLLDRLKSINADAEQWRKLALGEYPVDILNCKIATHGPCYDENTNKVRDARR